MWRERSDSHSSRSSRRCLESPGDARSRWRTRGPAWCWERTARSTYGVNDFGLFGGTDRGPITFARADGSRGAGYTWCVRHSNGEVGCADGRHGVDVGEDKRGAAGHRHAHEVLGVREESVHAAAGLAGMEASPEISGGAQPHARAQGRRNRVGWGAQTTSQLGLGDTDPRVQSHENPGAAGHHPHHRGRSTCRLHGRRTGSWVVWGAAPSPSHQGRRQGPPLRRSQPVAPAGSPCLRHADATTGIVSFRDGSVARGAATRTERSGPAAASMRSPGAKARSSVADRHRAGLDGINRVLALKSDGTLYFWGAAGTRQPCCVCPR